MALLAALWLLLPFSLDQQQAASPVAVIYDLESPEYSVGVIIEKVVEVGSEYEQFDVVGFDKDVILLEHRQTKEILRLMCQGELSKPLRRQARQRFIAKQLRRVYEAQAKYFSQYGYYASDFKDLIRRGFLPQSFENTKDQYRFEFVATKNPEGDGAQYRVLASDITESVEKDYFSVGPLGQVRMGETPEHAQWGAVVDYAGMKDVEYEYLGINEEFAP